MKKGLNGGNEVIKKGLPSPTQRNTEWNSFSENQKQTEVCQFPFANSSVIM